MKNLSLVFSFLAVTTISSLAASAPIVTVSTGDTSWLVDLTSTGDGTWDNSTTDASFSTSNSSIVIHTLSLDSDPSIDNFFGATNNSNTTQTYTLTIDLPVSLTAGQYAISTSIGTTVTNTSSSSNTIKVSPLASSYILKASIGGVDLGSSANLIDAPLTFNSVARHASKTLDPIEKDSIYNLTGSASTISVTTTFKLSPHAVAGFSYDFTVEAVPEPSTYALLALGAGVLFVASRYRGRAFGKAN